MWCDVCLREKRSWKQQTKRRCTSSSTKQQTKSAATAHDERIWSEMQWNENNNNNNVKTLFSHTYNYEIDWREFLSSHSGPRVQCARHQTHWADVVVTVCRNTRGSTMLNARCVCMHCTSTRCSLNYRASACRCKIQRVLFGFACFFSGEMYNTAMWRSKHPPYSIRFGKHNWNDA